VSQQPALKFLFVGYVTSVSEERVEALRDAGYAVDWLQDIGAAILKLWRGDYSALVIGPLISAADRRLLLAEAPRRNPAIKRITLSASQEPLEVNSDATIEVDTGVQSFVQNVKGLLAA
jgi:hypothetical protein